MMLKTNSNSRMISKNVYLEAMSEPNLVDNQDGIYIGKSCTFKIPFLLDLDKLINRNIAVLGMSGTGKSYFLKSFIIKSNLQRCSTILIIDWNNEYEKTVKYLGGRVLTLGKDFKINIFDIYDLRNVQNTKNISDLMGYLLNLNEGESYLLYNKILLGSNENADGLNVQQLVKEFRKANDSDSDRIASKLLQLRDNPIFADKTGFPIGTMFDGVISIDFSMLRDDTQRKEISKCIFRILTELMHKSSMERTSKGNERILILDEAWRLIKNSDDVGVLFREGRKYGFCVAVATQLTNDINNEVLSNSACLFLFRLQNESDYRVLRDCGIVNDAEIKKVMKLPVGSCMVHAALKDSSTTSKFFIESVDGVVIDFYVIRSGNMQNRISNRQMVKSTKMLNVGIEGRERIFNFIAANNNELEDVKLAEFMINLKIERAEIVYYLRSLGLKDIQIIKAYDTAVATSV